MDLYQQEILEHYKHPQNFGALPNASLVREEFNPTCGDRFTFYVHLNPSGIIDQVGFTGSGCAISTASASLLSEAIKGLSLEQTLKLDKDFVLNLLGVELLPVRLKCALLPLQAVTHLQHSNQS